MKLPRLRYDREIFDTALAQGLAVKGDLDFDLRAPGPHLVEVFLAVPDGGEHSFTLEAGGQAVDTRFRAFPQPAPAVARTGLRSVCLLGVLTGPFTVRSDSPRYFFSMVRWTPQDQFEGSLAPRWLDRARQLAADPFLEDLRAGRRVNLEQLYDRLALSRRPEIRREAVTGQARAAYWLAVGSQEPRDMARTDSLFREALNLAPGDKVLRQTISSSCQQRNIPSGRMPYGSYCLETAPVPWDVSLTPAPPEAPEWAVLQRRLAARLEAISKWWVEWRQRPNGELGGGWEADSGMLRQWGLAALGLGSPAAASGLRKLAEGLWTRWQVERSAGNREAAAGAEAARAALEAQTWLAALSPGDAGVVARLDQPPDRALGPALWYAYLTRDRTATGLLREMADSGLAAARSAGSAGSQARPAWFLLAVHHLTADARYLETAGESFQALARCESVPEACDEIRGSPQSYLEWRRLTGDSKYDAGFRYRGEPLATEVVWNMAVSARENETLLATDFDMYTSEVIDTGRVYYPLPPDYLRHIFGGEAPQADRYPAFAVTWPPSETQFARAVLASGPRSLTLRLFSFEARPSSAQVRLWRLEPGRYHWRSAEPYGAELASGDLVVAGRPETVRFPLPPAREIDVNIRPAQP
ncbi:MAG: hypothetical protein IT159_05305 [Bryobacterales bacterium]|nr:hypothetical protein [Bryobacterales bacterium]